MDKMTTIEPSQLFRTPSAAERALGIWVDRIGRKRDQGFPAHMRLLGLYGAVYVAEGEGTLECPSAGRLQVSAGQCMLLFPDEPHRYGPGDGTWETWWVVWGGEGSHTLEGLGYTDRNAPVITDDRLFRIIARPEALDSYPGTSGSAYRA